MSEYIPRPRVTDTPVCYLDFDGCLHSEDVWMRRGGHPYVRSPPGHTIFEHAEVLASLLRPYPDVRIVLSTTWARRLGYGKAVAYLPAELQARCVGATWHQGIRRYLYDSQSRGEQVLDDVGRRRPTEWLAIDDDVTGWGTWTTTHLVQSHPILGICEPTVLENLRQALRRFGGQA